MSCIQSFNVFLSERLMAVAGEIFEAFEKIILTYQEEISCSKVENQRLQKLLDIYRSTVSVEVTSDKQRNLEQECTAVLVQEDTLKQIKKEPELWTMRKSIPITHLVPNYTVYYHLPV